jgi:hypothetical protein
MSATNPIKGYEITVGYYRPDGDYRLLKKICLRLNKTGGAHITNKEDLIRLIEDAVFTNEKEEQ